MNPSLLPVLGLGLLALGARLGAQSLPTGSPGTDGTPEFTALLESGIANPAGDSAFVSFPDSGTANYAFSFDNKWIGSTGKAVHPDWTGPVAASVTGSAFDAAEQSFGHASGYVFNAFWPNGLTGINDFAPDAVPNNSGLYYDTIGRGGFFVGNGNSAGIGSWTITFDFTGLSNGYLPAGTLIGITDTGDDGTGNDAETTVLVAGLVATTISPWLTEIDYSLGQGGRDQPAPVYRGANTYDVGIETPKLATGGSEYSVVQTTEDIETLAITVTQGPGGGSHGFEIHAPTGIPEPSAPALLAGAALLFASRRRSRPGAP